MIQYLFNYAMAEVADFGSDCNDCGFEGHVMTY